MHISRVNTAGERQQDACSGADACTIAVRWIPRLRSRYRDRQDPQPNVTSFQPLSQSECDVFHKDNASVDVLHALDEYAV
ncbi:hypothetical protein TMEN_8882 [Trichophyton mentagrophytes]|nr:hypothetical protein TMEN_8882 [Trichophyton mentagrophytes]